MNEDDESVENAMSLSFLDVISCGMVSSIFLAIIFSVIGYTPAVSLRTDDFIAIVLKLKDNPNPSDGDNQVWNVALKPPGKPAEICIPLHEFSKSTGRYAKNDEFLKTVQIYGFDSGFYTGNNTGGYRIFFVSKPKHGQWSVRVFLRDWPLDGKPQKPDAIQIITSNKRNNQVYDFKDSQNKDCWQDLDVDGVMDGVMCTFDF